MLDRVVFCCYALFGHSITAEPWTITWDLDSEETDCVRVWMAHGRALCTCMSVQGSSSLSSSTAGRSRMHQVQKINTTGWRTTEDPNEWPIRQLPRFSTPVSLSLKFSGDYADLFPLILITFPISETCMRWVWLYITVQYEVTWNINLNLQALSWKITDNINSYKWAPLPSPQKDICSSHMQQGVIE